MEQTVLSLDISLKNKYCDDPPTHNKSGPNNPKIIPSNNCKKTICNDFTHSLLNKFITVANKYKDNPIMTKMLKEPYTNIGNNKYALVKAMANILYDELLKFEYLTIEQMVLSEIKGIPFPESINIPSNNILNPIKNPK
jgi:hypothetical protein